MDERPRKKKEEQRRAARLKALLVALIGLPALLAAALYASVRFSVPDAEGTVEVQGPAGRASITYDDFARPYVRAATLEDALYAQGWLHARERSWQMELLRRAGSGRLAELLGPSLLETDKALWRAGVPQLARRLAAQPSVQARRRVDAYVAGVNAGLESLRIRAPEFVLLATRPRPWTAEDVYAVGASIAWDSANNVDNELLRLELGRYVDRARFMAFVPMDGAAKGFPYVLPPAAAAPPASLAALDAVEQFGLPSTALGSNGWAVAPGRSRTGRALFAFDSHDTLSQPTLFYEVHLFFGAGRELRGWSLPGLPGVVNGYNEYWAWGLTNTGDTQDTFLLAPNEPVVKREQVAIRVRFRDHAFPLTVEYTAYGPIVSDSPRLALSWVGQQAASGGFDALLGLNLARSLDEINAAFDAFEVPAANATWASRDGHIGLRTIGRLPLRGAGEGVFPLTARPENRWRGLVPVDQAPRLLDPPDGFVAAANARVNPLGQGPLVSADNAPGYRIQRIQNTLRSRFDHDAASMRRLQLDWHNTQAEWLLPALLPALDKLPRADDPQASADVEAVDAARQLLRTWQGDPVNTPDSAAALIFERWYLQLARDLFADTLGPKLYQRLLQRNYVLNSALDQLVLALPQSPWWEDARDAKVRAAFVRAVKDLRAEFGGTPATWRWDDAHAVVLQHELSKAVPLLGTWLDRGPYPWGGSAATVGRAGYRYDRPSIVDYAATVRVVGELGPDSGLEMRAVMAAGQSGHPFSDFYDDQTPAWLAGELLPILRQPEDLRD
jgi:penicillin amidase